jgi:hypothetical protein
MPTSDRLITTSAAYQREATVENLAALPANERFFSAPGRRRLTAEQIVDSLHAAAGKPIDSEEITFVHDGRHTLDRRQTLGVPRRAWMFASLNNERDRPSLALPHAQTTVDVLEAFDEAATPSRALHGPVFAAASRGRGAVAVTRSWRSELAELAVKVARRAHRRDFPALLSRQPRPLWNALPSCRSARRIRDAARSAAEQV